mmetsp:Transcript_54902/g.66128  ORF Transcript_54902/g.66128 Transcript_54902/m.66128 type:complete len:93 (+) Transcript_54902:264-542(+)
MRLDEDGDEEHNNKPQFFTYSLTYDTNRHLRSSLLYLAVVRFHHAPSSYAASLHHHCYGSLRSFVTSVRRSSSSCAAVICCRPSFIAACRRH